MKMVKRTIIALAALIVAGCGEDPAVTAAKKQHAEFIGTEPKAVDVVGTYVLSDQTVISGGVSALAGRTCEINVSPDGSFSVTNYPQSSGTTFGSFLSVTGKRRIATVGISYGYGPEPKDCWGFQFEGAARSMDPAAFAGPQQPYDLLTIIGDPDSNQTLRFKRKTHTTTPPTVLSPAPGAGEGGPVKVSVGQEKR
jgi:hypothetical protein